MRPDPQLGALQGCPEAPGDRYAWLGSHEIRTQLLGVAKRLGFANDAEDAVQDFYLRKVPRLAAYYRPGAGVGLAVTAMRKFCFSLMRLRRNRQRLFEESVAAPVLAVAQSSRNLDEDGRIDQLALDVQIATLRRALSRLTSDDREVIELSDFRDLKHEQIALVTGRSVKSIKVALFRARRRLKKLIEDLATTFLMNDILDWQELVIESAAATSILGEATWSRLAPEARHLAKDLLESNRLPSFEDKKLLLASLNDLLDCANLWSSPEASALLRARFGNAAKGACLKNGVTRRRNRLLLEITLPGIFGQSTLGIEGL